MPRTGPPARVPDVPRPAEPGEPRPAFRALAVLAAASLTMGLMGLGARLLSGRARLASSGHAPEPGAYPGHPARAHGGEAPPPLRLLGPVAVGSGRTVPGRADPAGAGRVRLASAGRSPAGSRRPGITMSYSAVTPLAAGPCQAAVAEVERRGLYPEPGFEVICPGNALGHAGMTCRNIPDVCSGFEEIVIADPVAAVVANEFENSRIFADDPTARCQTIDCGHTAYGF